MARVAPGDLQNVLDQIRGEEDIASGIVHFLGGRVTMKLFENYDLPSSALHLRQTVTLTTSGSRATHCAPLRSQ